jgi:hypothetical protein
MHSRVLQLPALSQSGLGGHRKGKWRSVAHALFKGNCTRGQLMLYF